MASGHPSESQSRSPPIRQEPEEDDIIDTGRGDQSDAKKGLHQDDTQQQPALKRSRTPAYIAPITQIGSIPQVSPGIQISNADRPDIPPFIGSLLAGRLVDEDGDIVDEQTGQVLAHAAGDLPSMVGRRVSNAEGDILGDSGELLGYVADIEWGRTRPTAAPPRSLFDLMGRARSSLMVDDVGNILDASGNVVGKFHDNNNPLHRKEKEEREEREARELAYRSEESKQPQEQPQQRSPPPTPTPPQKQQDESQSTPAEGRPGPRRTEEERRQNAEAWRKENPGESPSDIFLDVKSTREGIQLTIRIPTVFNGQQTTPHISFS